MTDLRQKAARLLKQVRAAYRRSLQSTAVVEAAHQAMHVPEVQAVDPKPAVTGISRAWMEREIARRLAQGLPPEFERTGPTPPDSSPGSPKQ